MRFSGAIAAVALAWVTVTTAATPVEAQPGYHRSYRDHGYSRYRYRRHGYHYRRYDGRGLYRHGGYRGHYGRRY